MSFNRAFARIDAIAMGSALGLLLGGGLFLATALLLIRQGPVVGPHLSLLSQFIPGYRVSWGGSFLGLAFGLLGGFVGGWLAATFRNLLVQTYLYLVRFWASLNRFLDDA